ncbi:MAG: hypothetical protein M3380_20140, partial [Chloroflexota bacterium]|nr:hypothetical protein [Chloroflexota bacterium]
QELAFHLATQPELYRQFEAGLTARAAGPGLESAPTVEVETLRASLAGVGASDDLRARLAGAP